MFIVYVILEIIRCVDEEKEKICIIFFRVKITLQRETTCLIDLVNFDTYFFLYGNNKLP